jgi:hypothetical protein
VKDERKPFYFGKSLKRTIEPFKTTLPKHSMPAYFLSPIYKNTSCNSYGYRSDEFVKVHDGSHILFAGCSVTFGDGLEPEETWPWLVHNQIAKTSKTSGYFNLSVSGTSISYSIMMIYKYIQEFGKPDIIFFNMPTTERFFSIDEKTMDVVSSIDHADNKFDADSRVLAAAVHFEMYNMLEMYCKESGIRLISFTWNQMEEKKVSKTATAMVFKDFSTFMDVFQAYSFDKYIDSYVEENLSGLSLGNGIKVPYLTARDGMHQGTIHHSFYADAALNILDKDKYPKMDRFLK